MKTPSPKQGLHLQFVHEGESDPGLELVKRLLNDGHRDETPLDRTTAESALDALAAIKLEGIFGEIIEGGERLAEQIHSQATHGLQEIVQNAQDQSATRIDFAFRKRQGAGELLIAHDGAPVHIHDVVSMAYPMVSGSRRDADKIGRFGIGLKTLNQFGDRLEVHCPPLPGFHIQNGRIRRVPDARDVPGFWSSDSGQTLFILRLKDERFDADFFKKWIEEWNASSLIFLTSLRSIAFFDLRTAKPVIRHAVEVVTKTDVDLAFQRAHDATRTELRELGSTRRWTLYRARYPVPKNITRTNKALKNSVELAIASPNRQSESRVYAGLPLEEPSSLSFSCAAPFDINVDRTSLLQNNDLNEWLVARLSELVVAVAEDSLNHRPKEMWRWMPLAEETAGTPGSWLRSQINGFTRRIREQLAARLRISAIDGSEVKLKDLFFEAPALTELFAPSELEQLDIERFPAWRRNFDVKRVLPSHYRDKSGRWRSVLRDIDGPRELTVRNGLDALKWPAEHVRSRGADWLVRLCNAAIDAEAEDDLLDLPCLLLDGLDDLEIPNTLASAGRLLVSSVPDSGLAAALGRVNRLAIGFRAENEQANKVRNWLSTSGLLHERVTDVVAHEALSKANGESPVDLSDDVKLVQAMRSAFEQLTATQREAIGEGVGRNVLLAGFRHDSRGTRQPLAVSPANAYIPYKIEKVAAGWANAANKTPSLQWIDDSYADSLRSSRDTNSSNKRQGALAFLRTLGAATAPRLNRGLTEDPDPNATLPKYLLTPHQLDELAKFPRARTLRDDWDSSDLAAVLASIIADQSEKDRRQRAVALFQCLHRAWPHQYAGRATAVAAHHYRSWFVDGVVSATWVGRLASEPWLSTRERKFTPKPPRELAIRTEASFEIEGESPGRYAYELEPKDADSPLLDAIGVEGKPSVETIIERLGDLRAADESGSAINQLLVERCYHALAAYCPGGQHENETSINRATWRDWFGTTPGQPGLIRIQGQWLSIPEVRRGVCLGPRLPFVESPAPLWNYLEVPQTTVADCRRILDSLANDNAEDSNDFCGTEIAVLRRLVVLADQRGVKKALAGVPLRTYQGWTDGATPVFAIGNKSLAEEVGSHWPIWRIPIALSEMLPLVNLLGVTLLTDTDIRPDVPSTAIVQTDLQTDLPAIVNHLRNYVFRNHEPLHKRVHADRWDALGKADVALGTSWALKISAPGRRTLRICPPAHVFEGPVLFCALDEEEAGRQDAGGRAVADYLLGDDARAEDAAFIALAWESAFRRRDEREDSIVVDAPRQEGPAEGEVMPAWRDKRGAATLARKAQLRGRRPEKEAPRELVDLEELDMSSVVVTVASKNRNGNFRFPGKRVLMEPRKSRSPDSKIPASAMRAGDRNYTATDREDNALAIAEAWLADNEGLNLEDIRYQGNVGADAVDRTRDIWVEIKAFGRERGDTVRLEPSEAVRAKEKGDQYWLVLVCNLEKPRTPRVEIVQNPLARLDTFLGRGIKLVGLNELASDSP